MEWKNSFEKGKEVILVTSSKESVPNANVVISLGFIDGKVVIADCQMDMTRKNIDDNQNVCILSRDESYYRLVGVAEIITSGQIFDEIKDADKDYEVKAVILIDIRKVFDLDKCEEMKL